MALEAARKTVVEVETVIAEQEVLLNALSAMTTENGRLSVLTNDLEIIGELNPNGIFRTDANGKVTYANRHWFEITGTTSLGDECDRWLDRVVDGDRDEVRAQWEAALKSPGGRVSRELRMQRATGCAAAVVWINAVTLAESPLAAGAGVHAVVGALIDVTHWHDHERKEMAALTEIADVQRHRADDADDRCIEQERYIDVVCHEIRNPLNGIVSNVDLLCDGRSHLRSLVGAAVEDPAKAHAVLAILDDEDVMLNAVRLCAEHQLRVTNDVLHLSRLRLGRSVLEESCFCVEELVGNIVRMFQAEALAYHVELAYRYAADKAGVPLRGDVQRISQIIVNLLANAIKFTRLAPTRQVVVETWVDLAGDADPEPGRHTFIVSVHDTGIGMTAEERAQLFVPFRQATAHTHVAYGGSGLGLFITKQLLELMGGGINVDSTPGVGTTFTIEIPVHLMADDAHADSGSSMKGSEGLAAGPMAADHDDDDAYEHEHAASMGSSRHNDMVEAVAPGRMATAGTAVFPQPDHQVPHLPLPIRILVVDDNDINRAVLVRHLNALSHDCGLMINVIAVADGADAVAAATADGGEPIDLVFMDIQMEPMDGLEATRRIRAFEAEHGRASVPIVGVSGNARQEHVQRAEASGMSGYMIKPYNRESVLKTIERLLGPLHSPA